ncbi:uncharacterized protein [Palaemon carinicauda]|uniref:uncharacterized protein n=1 Tax=Palaemon carinicauda TaxID=392227 RepID=UPI0035B5F9B3
MKSLLDEGYADGVQIFIFADDVCIVVPHSVFKEHRKISDKVKDLVLKVNPSKTKAMDIKHMASPPPLRLLVAPIEWVSNFAYLGVYINYRLLAAPEIPMLKSRTNSHINALKRITSLRLFYVQAVRFLVEYSTPVLTSLSPTQKPQLEVIQNNAMRTILGALIWTRLSLLRTDTNILPLVDRINIRNHSLIIKTIKTDRNDYVTQPSWVPSPLRFNYTAIPVSKALCIPDVAFRASLPSIQNTPANIFYFTDDSVERSVPAAAGVVYSESFQASWRLSNGASTLQTELVAIVKALEHSVTAQRHITIRTDSTGALSAIKNSTVKENTLILSNIMHLTFVHFQNHMQVTLNWIPSHSGIQGNAAADSPARGALAVDTLSITLNSSVRHLQKSMFNYLHNQLLSDVRQAQLDSSRSATWYINITNLVLQFLPKSNLRHLAVILHRLRLGYS